MQICIGLGLNTESAGYGVCTCRLCGQVSCCSRLPGVFLLLICMARWGGFWQLVPRLSRCWAQPCKKAPGKEPHHSEDPVTFQPRHLQSAFRKPFWSASWQQPDIRNGAVQPLNSEHSFLLSQNRGVLVGREQSWHCSQCTWLPDLCLVSIQTPTPDSVWALRKILSAVEWPSVKGQLPRGRIDAHARKCVLSSPFSCWSRRPTFLAASKPTGGYHLTK